jgi:hypothetical protein
MAANTEKATRTTSEIFGGFEAAQQAWKDVFNFQTRTAKALVEQGFGMTRKATEHFIAQLDESVKLQQDAIRYGLHLADDFKKVAFEAMEKTAQQQQ